MKLRTLLCLLALALALGAQDQTTITISGTSKYRLAVPDFIAGAGIAPSVANTFNQVLWNDLYQSAVVTMVGRSLYTVPAPASETVLNDPAARAAWSMPPLSIQRLAFGTMAVAGGGLVVEGFLYDVTQPPGAGRLLARRYADPNTPAGARAIAHQLADDIVAALGFGPGIAASHIAYISNQSGSQEVWTMDYDGYGKQQRTHLHSIAYNPSFSPDGAKLAFMSSASGRPQIRLISLLTNQPLPFPSFKGIVETPSWSPDGAKLAFSANMGGQNMEIYTINANGTDLHRLTFSHGYDNLSPVWNPKPPPGSGGQIAFVSSRIGSPQIYIMNADGSHLQRLPLGGYAADPSWSPNGQVLAFAWVRNGGGENSGAFDIYLWYFANQTYVQLTHNGEENDCPSWAPDGRHVVFQSGPGGHTQLYTVAVDGSVPAQLTTTGDNEMPDWSWH